MLRTGRRRLAQYRFAYKSVRLQQSLPYGHFAYKVYILSPNCPFAYLMRAPQLRNIGTHLSNTLALAHQHGLHGQELQYIVGDETVEVRRGPPVTTTTYTDLTLNISH